MPTWTYTDLLPPTGKELLANQHRVLVIADNGVGATTVCNALTGETRPTSANTGHLTVNPKPGDGQNPNWFDGARAGSEGAYYHLLDSTSVGGTAKNTLECMQYIIELMKCQEIGFDLIVFVVDENFLQPNVVAYFDLVLVHLLQKHIPCILVANCKNAPFKTEDDMEQYTKTKLNDFHETYKNWCSNFTLVTLQFENDDYKEIETSSAKKLWDLIIQKAKGPIKLLEEQGGLWERIKRFFKNLFPSWRTKIMPSLNTALQGMGPNEKRMLGMLFGQVTRNEGFKLEMSKELTQQEKADEAASN